MKNISGYIFKLMLLIGCIQGVRGQDTLRTFGPRIGLDISRFVYLFLDPAETAAEATLDAEVYRNLYPVLEVGYSSLDEKEGDFDYSMNGGYFRVGADYNVLKPKERSVHHTLTVGLRYGLAQFKHRAEHVTIPSDYWGDYLLESHENSLTGHWLELVGGVKAEIFNNFFLGWSLRYKILLNPEIDPLFTPLIVPGYGKGSMNRGLGFSYTVSYMFPILKK